MWEDKPLNNKGTHRLPSSKPLWSIVYLTHWGRVTYICVSKLTIIGWDKGLAPARWQAIIWTNAGILIIGPLGTNFSEILIEIYIFSFKKMHLKMSSGKWWPFCLGLNVLMAICMLHYMSNMNYHSCSCRWDSMVVADGLAPIWRQAICNHHDGIGLSGHLRSIPTMNTE